MTSDKIAIQLIAVRCMEHGIRHVVISPGSRSAPLVIAFSDSKELECSVIPDERVAGYFALGIAQQLKIPVAVICTSGTAVLNLAPALCEAYYQNIPLLAITADRPQGSHLSGENQAILQKDVFKNFVGFSASINGELGSNDALDDIEKIVAESFSMLQQPNAQPVHWNIHLQEPLYGKGERFKNFSAVVSKTTEVDNAEYQDTAELLNVWNTSSKKLVILGMQPERTDILSALQKLSTRADVVIWTESTSNFPGNGSTISNVDACLASLSPEEETDFVPDVVITLGRQIISKRIKSFLRKYKPVHFDIAPGKNLARNWDIFGSLRKNPLPYDEEKVLELLSGTHVSSSSFSLGWQKLSAIVKSRHTSFLSEAPFCDLKVFETLVHSFPPGANVQYGNSSPVRYSNLFEHKHVSVSANRGTSGIDGCVSTAAGAAYATKNLTINIVGDISFLYDSNALWNKQLSEHLRIVVINNGGGNIFRMIDGPQSVNQFENYFETKHELNVAHLASMYGLPYYICSTENELKKTLPAFFNAQGGKAAILEIKTDGMLSAEVYKQYFSQLKRK
jgi:2-succinyl-5-enolpyruvyl-6-hydroxy-3-cyclohexene-1-carboxylate synthase